MSTARDRAVAKIAELEAEVAELRDQLASGVAEGPDAERPEYIGDQDPGVAQRRFFADLLEHLPTMVFVKDAKDLRLISLNRAGEELLGLPRSEVLGKSDYDLFPPEQADFFVAKDRTVLAGRCAVDIPEEPIHTPHGERWLHTRKVPLIDAHNEPVYLLGLAVDITEQRRAKLELMRKTEALTRSNRDLEQFALVASHDIKEPLRRIRSYGDLLMDEHGQELSSEARDYVGRMRDGAERLQSLVDSLLAYSRVATQPMPRSWVDLGGLVGSVVSDLDAASRERGARVEVGDLPAVFGDAQQLRQLLQNLIGNALKFVDRTRTPLVQVSGRVDGDACVIAVQDNGIGIAPEHIDQIFDMFQRLHASQEFPGSGIGLAVCKKIVERHGGTLTVASAVGQGTRFEARLPFVAYDFQV
ncbi:MAG: PAS domain-containing protein [Deltaproteobacteria bacterium]|nr:PAS domain-containing protein [Deltaproteobacteria bacterium]